MPTARELLEQADALMRRNRIAVPDDIPVLTDSVSPRPVFRVPLRPSPESPPVVLDDEPEIIPTLTEEASAGAAPPAGEMIAEGEPSDWLDLDEGEPSVTGRAPDSVLSVPKVPDETARAIAHFDDEGEASEAPVIAEEEASFEDEEAPFAGDGVLPPMEEIEIPPAAEALFDEEFGDAPVDVADAADEPPVVPEPALPAALADEPALPQSHDEMARAGAEAEAADEAEAEVADEAEDTDAEEYADTVAPAIEPLPALAAETEMVIDAPAAVAWNVEAALTAPDVAADVTPVDEVVAAVAAAPIAAAHDESHTFAATPATEADEPALAAAPAAALVAAPAPPSAPAPDDARWVAMAEEVRMQVLQRIDLFTDTGLREQLGRRLQPIVDRASADLVATINQHVGELLRAYVAEAIEREIESWRRSTK